MKRFAALAISLAFLIACSGTDKRPAVNDGGVKKAQTEALPNGDDDDDPGPIVSPPPPPPPPPKKTPDAGTSEQHQR